MKSARHSIEVWLFSRASGRVLLMQKRPVAGRHEAFWQPITGGIQPGESSWQAARREVGEETGFEVYDLVDGGTDIIMETPDYRLQRRPYASFVEEREPVLDPAEHIAFAWVEPAEVLSRLGQASSRQGWVIIQSALAGQD